MLYFDVFVPTFGIFRFNFDWSYDVSTAVVPLVTVRLREEYDILPAVNGATAIREDLDYVLWIAGTDHFGFTGAVGDIANRTRQVLEAIAKIKLLNMLDDNGRRVVDLRDEQLQLPI